MKRCRRCAGWVVAVIGAGVISSTLLGNGGPFVVKYPEGDPAAKGVLARLEPDLKPGRIDDLRVVKEDLKITFANDFNLPGAAREKGKRPLPPLANVSAAYTIENPTDKEVTIEFGFPILRGIYIPPYLMMPRPEVHVYMADPAAGPTSRPASVQANVISNSVIYGIIRRDARALIDKAIAADKELPTLVEAVRSAKLDQRDVARAALRTHATGNMKWRERDAALLVEYASVDFGKPVSWAPDSTPMYSLAPGGAAREAVDLYTANLGLLSAIGEQKATQFFAQLAGCFDPKAASNYEAIFAAWGGDVREQSIDMTTGKVRPREIKVDAAQPLKDEPWQTHGSDPTVYARVDYLDSDVKLSVQQKESCRAVLKNLPVVFTFAPMNLLHYKAVFPAKSTRVLTVAYSQYAYRDTADEGSYQLAYVVHPASMWKEFGPINLSIIAPQSVVVKSSVALETKNAANMPDAPETVAKVAWSAHTAVLKEKTGMIYVGIDAAAWDKHVDPAPAKK